VGEDSNINVYEFGNLILADIFPTLVWLLNFVSDILGDLITVTDSNGNAVDASDLSDSQIDMLDTGGTLVTITDNLGNLVTVCDNGVTLSVDSNINVFEFANLILADILPSLLWTVNQIMDLMGISVDTSDKTQDNTITYDCESYTYDDGSINYLGYVSQGYTTMTYGSLSSLVDISGS
jgi:hypothetical protein